MAKRRKASAATRARLKALRKKHGLGEFQNKTHTKTRRVSHRSNKVAKRKRSVRRGIMGGLQRPLVAGITYALVQPFLSQFLKRFNIGLQDELVQILAAVVLKNMVKNPIVTNWANAAIIINTASLTSVFANRILPTLTRTPAPASTNPNNSLPFINT